LVDKRNIELQNVIQLLTSSRVNNFKRRCDRYIRVSAR